MWLWHSFPFLFIWSVEIFFIHSRNLIWILYGDLKPLGSLEAKRTCISIYMGSWPICLYKNFMPVTIWYTRVLTWTGVPWTRAWEGGCKYHSIIVGIGSNVSIFTTKFFSFNLNKRNHFHKQPHRNPLF